MWLVHGPRESILCERAFSSQEAESGIAVTILISNAQPVLYCAVEAEPRTLVAESKTAEHVLAMSREDATKEGDGGGRAPLAGSTTCSTRASEQLARLLGTAAALSGVALGCYAARLRAGGR